MVGDLHFRAMSSPEQSGPIVVYGATGYTGKLVAAELARRGADFVIAGRSASKLNALAATLADGPGVVAVTLDDAAGLRALLRDAAAVIACAGPFALCGEAVLAAAVETGTDYVDTTGEQPFIRKVFDEYRDWVRDTMTTEPEPFIQVLAAAIR